MNQPLATPAAPAMPAASEAGTQPHGVVEVVDQHFVDGYPPGMRQTAMRVRVRVQAPQGRRWGVASRLISQELRLPRQAAGAREPPAEWAIARRLLRWARALLDRAGHPVFEDGRVLDARGAQGETHVLLLPCLDAQSGGDALTAARQLIEEDFAFGAEADPAQVRAALRTRVEDHVKRLAPRAPGGFNTLHFLRMAHEHGVPWSRVTPDVFQFGWGARSRWLSSSFTDGSSVIAAGIARDKAKASRLLAQSGIPVAAQVAVRDEPHALSQARALGLPVVIKPADQDGGVGVSAWLETDDEIRQAFAAARKVAKRVLMERHFHGRDYRVQVVLGEVQGIVERTPGGVTGDGSASVQDLVNRQNSERRTATDDRKYLKPMSVDAEALRMLAKRGQSAATVPAAGEFVRLRAAANVASGGVPVLLDIATAHPDNLALATRAARVLRLDVAGIDLMIPDISRSWMESGAIVCEVNGQPQMFTSMHAPMLRSLLGGTDGRVPTCLVVARSASDDCARRIDQALRAQGKAAGCYAQGVATLAGRPLHAGRGTLAQVAPMILRDRATQAVVMAVDDPAQAWGRHGLPLDRCDVLVLHRPDGDADLTPDACAMLIGALAPRVLCMSQTLRGQLVAAGATLPAGAEQMDLIDGPVDDSAAQAIARKLLSLPAQGSWA